MLHDLMNRQGAMTAIKTVGRSGQISLGKEYAGRHVLVEETAPGVWLVKLGEFIPDSEHWMWEPQAKVNIDRALAWAESHPPQATDLETLAGRVKK
jgi:hypothetical protein